MKSHSKDKNMIYGTRSAIEAVQAGKEIEKVFINIQSNDLHRELLGLLHTKKIPYNKVPYEKLNRLTRKNHQGVVAFLSPIKYYELDDLVNKAYSEGKDPFFIILDGITDVRNLGAIARTAEVAGLDGLVIPVKGSAQVNPDAVKTSAGALHSLPVCRSFDLKETVSQLKESGVKVIACTEKTEDSVYNSSMKGPVAIVMGSEDQGISEVLLKSADELVSIPQFGTIESLNVSVASAVVIYEAVRQRL
jgi:23S rRNA (guanosine2251-2'-O)-methyltransferase